MKGRSLTFAAYTATRTKADRWPLGWRPFAMVLAELVSPAVLEPENMPARVSKHYTVPHRRLEKLLTEAGYDIVSECTFGRFRVDVYVPSLHLAFEADGFHWHGSPVQQERDKVRDAELLALYGLPVVRLTEEELRRVMPRCS